MMSLAWSPAQLRSSWRLPLLLVACLLLLVLIVHRETGAAMVGVWMRSETFTHAFVVPPIVAWLIWGKRATLAPLRPQPSAWALLPMAGAALLWWVGQLAHVAAASHLALMVILVASVPLVLGWRVTQALAFPLAFAFFAVPIGEFLTPTLMHWTAEVLIASLRMTGIPVYQEGQHLVIPSGRWAVVEACSGIRYLMATFMVGSLFAYLNYQRTSKRLVFVAVSLVLPVVANWVRAYIIVMLGHLSNNRIATGVDHLVYGWVFFGIVILSLFFIGARWADVAGGDDAATAAEQQPPAHLEPPVPIWRSVGLASVALVLLIGSALQAEPGRSVVAAPRLDLPAAMGPWQRLPVVNPAAGGWSPAFPKASKLVSADYRSADATVGVHVAYYRGQDADTKLVSSVNGFVGPSPSPWHVVSGRTVTSNVHGVAVTWREALLTLDGAQLGSDKPRLTVWRLYWLGGPLAEDDRRATLIQAWRAMSGESDDGAAIHLVSDLHDPTAAQQLLARFANENFAMLERALTAARDSR